MLVHYRSGELTTSDESPELGWFTTEQTLELVTHPVNHDRPKTLLDFAGENPVPQLYPAPLPGA